MGRDTCHCVRLLQGLFQGHWRGTGGTAAPKEVALPALGSLCHRLWGAVRELSENPYFWSRRHSAPSFPCASAVRAAP